MTSEDSYSPLAEYEITYKTRRWPWSPRRVEKVRASQVLFRDGNAVFHGWFDHKWTFVASVSMMDTASIRRIEP